MESKLDETASRKQVWRLKEMKINRLARYSIIKYYKRKGFYKKTG